MSMSTAKRGDLSTYPGKEDDDLPLHEIRDAFNPAFVKTFDKLGLDPQLIKEFIYALDLLDNIVKTPNFVSGRILNNRDIEAYGEEAVFAFNRNNNIPYYYVRLGITVSETVYKLQDEFLERDYPKTILSILRPMRTPGIDATVDGHPYNVGITFKTPHPLFGLVNYQDLRTGMNTSVPFLLTRVGL